MYRTSYNLLLQLAPNGLSLNQLFCGHTCPLHIMTRRPILVLLSYSRPSRRVGFSRRLCQVESVHLVEIIVFSMSTSAQSKLTEGRIAVAHWRFKRIRQVASLCTPI